MRKKLHLLISATAAVCLLFTAVPRTVMGAEGNIIPDAVSAVSTEPTETTLQESTDAEIGTFTSKASENEYTDTAAVKESEKMTDASVGDMEEPASPDDGAGVEDQKSETFGQGVNADAAVDGGAATEAAGSGTTDPQTQEITSGSEKQDAGTAKTANNGNEAETSSADTEQGVGEPTGEETPEDESASSENSPTEDEAKRENIIAAEKAYEEIANAEDADKAAVEEAAKKAADCLEVYFGDGSQYRQGIGGGWWYEISGSRQYFTGLYLDGKVIDESMYSVSDDCAWTIVMLDFLFQNTDLPLGTHTLTFAYSYGAIDATLYCVSDGEQKPSPRKTGTDTAAPAGTNIYLNSQNTAVIIVPPVQTGDPGMAASAAVVLMSFLGGGCISAVRMGKKRKKKS